MEIVIATVVIGVIGLLIGVGLVFTGKKFHVEVDERVPQVRECLPGNNCGACGFAGCDAVAEAIVKGEAAPNACPINSADNMNKIGEIVGAEAEAPVRKIAFVRCAGDCNATNNTCNYVGEVDCRAAVMAGISIWECDYGCIGYGSCVKACQYDAIHVENGVAIVDKNKCVGCGMCAKACPKNLIELIEEGKLVAVRCMNKDKGPDVRNVCSAGCIGCMLCTRQCDFGAITVENNNASIDYYKCVGCGKCAEKCPTKIITYL